MFEKQTIDLFKVVVIDEKQRVKKLFTDNVSLGYVTDFKPTQAQASVLATSFAPLPVTTLFTVEERKTGDIHALILKQILHYVEVYGLDAPGLFDLEVTKGKTVSIANVRGVTTDELGAMVRKLLYANAPVRELEALTEIIRHYELAYDLKQVANNEARIRLYRDGDKFDNGDDAVRYIVYKATDDSLLIKSPKVIAAVEENAKRISLSFLAAHEAVLAKVFNRHKRLLIAIKNNGNKTAINRISRLSKDLHVPIIPAINKTFIAKALSDQIRDYAVLDQISLRDKFKYLNLLEWRRLGRSDDVFVVRNGKAHLEADRQTYAPEQIDHLKLLVLNSAHKNLHHLKGKRILLDGNVDYGLPSTQKQMLGNLPFGTQVSVAGNTIASGIYWENRGGARDLDLSSVNENGERTGWGQYSGYDRNNAITFSGDVTDARDGAMEFLTSAVKEKLLYGIYVNIFNGEEGAEASLVVGHQTEKKWINGAVVREKFKLPSKQSILGFVSGGKFLVYALRTSNSRVSGGEITKRLIAKGLAPSWTVRKLLDTAGIAYDTEENGKQPYDYDLRYSSFSIDKLENMLFNQ